MPSFTFELGPTSGTCSGFTPAYSCMDSLFWPKNLPRCSMRPRPLVTLTLSPLGPTTTGPAVSAATVTAGASVTLSATARDNAFGTSGPGTAGRPNPTAQAVNAAALFGGGTPVGGADSHHESH